MCPFQKYQAMVSAILEQIFPENLKGLILQYLAIKSWPFLILKPSSNREQEKAWDPVHVAFQNVDELKNGWNEMYVWEKHHSMEVYATLNQIFPKDLQKVIMQYQSLPTPALRMCTNDLTILSLPRDTYDFFRHNMSTSNNLEISIHILSFISKRTIRVCFILSSGDSILTQHYKKFLTKFIRYYSFYELALLITSLATTHFPESSPGTDYACNISLCVFFLVVMNLFTSILFVKRVLTNHFHEAYFRGSDFVGDLLALMRFPNVSRSPVPPTTIWYIKESQIFLGMCLRAQQTWVLVTGRIPKVHPNGDGLEWATAVNKRSFLKDRKWAKELIYVTQTHLCSQTDKHFSEL